MADLCDRDPQAVVRAVDRMARRGIDRPAAARKLGLEPDELVKLLHKGQGPVIRLLRGGL